MTIKMNLPVAPTFGSRMKRSFSARITGAASSRKKCSDEGALLVEVLVGMLILVIVFTSTTIALSNMSKQRVHIEQRDQAIALLLTYEEQSRMFRCGYIVDVIDDKLAKPGFVNGAAQLDNDINNCDFGSLGYAGDQNFPVSETINEIGSQRTFQVSIRYWWERPGSTVHKNVSCPSIGTPSTGSLPAILTRAFRVQWVEDGVDREEILIKRDPAPNDDVVFASGNRKNILVQLPGSGTANLVLSPTARVHKIVDGIMGQPEHCVWFPYITPNGLPREISGTVSNIVSADSIRDAEPQGSVPVS